MCVVLYYPKSYNSYTKKITMSSYDAEAGFAAKLLAKMNITSNIKTVIEKDESEYCEAYTAAGKRCSRAAKIDGYCGSHAKHLNEDGEYKPPKSSVSKRPPSAYICFKRYYREKHAEDMKGIPFGEQQSLMSNKWKQMEDRTMFNDMAKKARDEFYKNNPEKQKVTKRKRARNAYIFFKQHNTFSGKFEERQKKASIAWKGLSDAEREPYKKMAEKDKMEFLKEKGETGPQRPKRPLTAYNCFMMDMDKKIREDYPDLSFGDLAKKRSEIWTDMKCNGWAEMDHYKELAKKDKERYEKELAEFVAAGGSLKKKKKDKKEPTSKISKMPKELESDNEDDDDEYDEIEMYEFVTSQTLPSSYKLSNLLVDPNTKLVYVTDEDDAANVVGKAESVTLNDDGEVIDIGIIHFD